MAPSRKDLAFYQYFGDFWAKFGFLTPCVPIYRPNAPPKVRKKTILLNMCTELDVVHLLKVMQGISYMFSAKTAKKCRF